MVNTRGERIAPYVENACYYPTVQYTCLYKESLCTVLPLDANEGKNHFEVQAKSFIVLTSEEIGTPNAHDIHPAIAQRHLTFNH